MKQEVTKPSDGMKINQPKTSIAFLKKAIQIQSQRGEEYDSSSKKKKKERSFDKIASIFNTITDKDLTPAHVALLLQILKDVRQFSEDRFHSDSVEDCVSYASLKAELLYKQYNPKPEQKQVYKLAIVIDGKLFVTNKLTMYGRDILELTHKTVLESTKVYYQEGNQSCELPKDEYAFLSDGLTFWTTED